MRNKLLLLTFFATLSSHAAIVTSTGVTVLPTAPASVALNALESNTTVFAFQEREGITLALPALVDATAPGTYDQLTDIPLPSSIPAGTTVNSYLLHADPDLSIVTAGFVLNSGSVTFTPGETIIGLQFLETTLLLSNITIGAPGTLYPPPPVGFGLELTDLVVLAGSDVFTISADRQSVSFDWITGSGFDTGGVDQIRILTSPASVPEPLTGLLTFAGLTGLFIARRRKASAVNR